MRTSPPSGSGFEGAAGGAWRRGLLAGGRLRPLVHEVGHVRRAGPAPRNLFRGAKRAFAADARAITVAAAAIARGLDMRVTNEMRWFFYLPFEHAEDATLQRECVRLFAKLGDTVGLRFAELHADIIDRFGRFPHRNAILGRASTANEKAFLEEGGFAG
jgi:uncharacterized protein (DUF924 family)